MRQRSKRRIVIYWFLCSVAFFVVLVSFYSIRTLEKKKTFISPVSKQNQEQTEQINRITELLKEKRISFSGVFVYDASSYLIKLGSGEDVFLARGKSLVEQVSSLQLILSRLTIEGKRVSRVDFRFDTPVLTIQ